MPLRPKNLTLSVLLLAVSILALIIDLTYVPDRGGYMTTITSIQTVYETMRVWTNLTLLACGLIILLAVS